LESLCQKQDALLPRMRRSLVSIEKHKNDHSRLLAEQKLMKRDRNNIQNDR
jgi:hypothetical protein